MSRFLPGGIFISAPSGATCRFHSTRVVTFVPRCSRCGSAPSDPLASAGFSYRNNADEPGLENGPAQNSSVAMVAAINPPITATTKRRVFAPPPSPNPSAMGTMPITMANAVITTGRKPGLLPDSIAARARESPCSPRRSLANETTRMLY